MLKIPEDVRAWRNMNNVEQANFMERKLPEERMRFYATLNTIYIMECNNIDTQREFCEKMDIPPAALSKIISGKQNPSLYPFLFKIREIFHCDIDAFLTLDMRAADIVDPYYPVANHMSFQGLYYMYYSPDGKELKCGLLLLRKMSGAEANHLGAIAVFGLSRGEADVLYRDALDKSGHGTTPSNTWNYIETLKLSCKVYKGQAVLSDRHISINLNYKHYSDIVSLLLHKPTGGRKYIGGLGTCTSIGRGSGGLLCYQNILISDKALQDEEQGIMQQLTVKMEENSSLDQSAEEDVNKLTEMVIRLFKNENTEYLTDEEKKYLVNQKMKSILRNTQNQPSYRGFVSRDDDEKSYRYLLKYR